MLSERVLSKTGMSFHLCRLGFYMPVLSCGRLTPQLHGYSFSNIISCVPQSDHYHFKYAMLRIVGVFITIYQGEWTKPLPSSKVKHVHSARPEPRYLVGKVPSVHVFENINKSRRYELIMKSQAAWVQKSRGGGVLEGWQLDTGLRNRKEWLTIPLAEEETWIPLWHIHWVLYAHTCASNTAHSAYLNTMTPRDETEPHIWTLEC